MRLSLQRTHDIPIWQPHSTWWLSEDGIERSKPKQSVFDDLTAAITTLAVFEIPSGRARRGMAACSWGPLMRKVVEPTVPIVGPVERYAR